MLWLLLAVPVVALLAWLASRTATEEGERVDWDGMVGEEAEVETEADSEPDADAEAETSSETETEAETEDEDEDEEPKK